MSLGTPENPLRVAIVGSGPSGFYAAEHLFRTLEAGVRVDMIERLPTPYGLVRGGVAPDHPKIKSVTKVYDRIAARDGFRFLGNVEFGTALTLDDLQRHYNAVIFATGAQTDRALGIPGEDLPGSHAATEFVAWYNGHPDYRDRRFDLSAERAIVVGVGNVAMDVARILTRTCDELISTDIADYALDALQASRVREVIVLGRRGPAQAAFTPAELKEMGEMAEAEVVVSPEDAALDPLSAEALAASKDRDAEKNLALLKAYSESAPQGRPRRIVFRFLASPLEIKGSGRVESVVIGRNALVRRDDGTLAARPTGETVEVPAGLVFRSVGYRGVSLPGLPFDERVGVIPNREGRIVTVPAGEAIVGLYVVGWIKRGPSGVIGTNKPDAVETVDHLLRDARAGAIWMPEAADDGGIDALLQRRGVQVVDFAAWQTLDQRETEAGGRVGRPRVKFTRIDEMLSIIKDSNP